MLTAWQARPHQSRAGQGFRGVRHHCEQYQDLAKSAEKLVEQAVDGNLQAIRESPTAQTARRPN
jgi:hypothetical protein